jgi:hypothetical protein
MPQNAMPAPAGATPIPAQGDRAAVCRPIAGVVCNGDKLIAARGADLSPYCIHCGLPSAGKPLVLRYVPPDGSTGDLAGCMDEPIGGLIAVLFLSVYAVLSVTVPRLSARRQNVTVTVAIGLCEQHRCHRRRIRRAAAFVLLLSLALFAGGLWAWIAATHSPQGLTNDFPRMAIIASPILAILAPLILFSRLRTPRLTTAPDGRLLITGAGDPFLNAQTAVAP